MKNIVICVDTDEECTKTLERLSSKIDLNHATIHLVHVFEINLSNVDFTPVIYPTKDQYAEIEKNILEYLGGISTKLNLNAEFVQLHCFFSHSKHRCLNDYLEKINADTVVLATKGRHGITGFFASSLADFLCKYSPCDVFVLRP